MEPSKMDSYLAGRLKKVYLGSRHEIQNYQLERWNELLAYVKERSDYYQSYPESVRNLKEVENIPFTTEETILYHPEELQLLSLSKISRIISDTSTGTIHSPKRIFYTENDQALTVEFFAWGLSEVMHTNRNVCIMMPHNQDGSLGKLIEQALRIIGQKGVIIPKNWTYDELFSFIRENKCGYLIGLPGHILTFSRWLRARKLSLKLDGILVSADSCPKWMKAQIEEFYGCKVWNHYGSRESGLGGGVDCSAFAGMHLRECDLYVEIIDNNGNVLEDGKVGEIVITTFGREAMPLLRYRTKDKGVLLSKACECGGLTKRLVKVNRSGLDRSLLLDEVVIGKGLADDLICEKKGEALELSILGHQLIKTKHLQEMLCLVSENINLPIHLIQRMDILNPSIRPFSYGKRAIRE